jgi:hypothetical protein
MKHILQKDTNTSDKRKETIIKYDKNNKILLRKKKLFDHLDNEKLEYIKYGVCDAYIKYGTPSLEDVVKNMQCVSEKKMTRLKKLLKKLKDEGERYDEKITYYQQYIINGFDFDYSVNEGIKEWFYINKTNYLELLKIYKDEDKAQSMAFNQYVKANGHDKYTERIQQKDISLQIND